MECIYCKKDTLSRILVDIKPPLILKLTEEDRERGIIQEQCCQNTIKLRHTIRRKDKPTEYVWEECICNNHTMRVRYKK